jgi:hypothetical protein
MTTECGVEREKKGSPHRKPISGGRKKVDPMDAVKVKWLIDLLMGISFLVCLVTGLLKYSVLLQLTGLNNVVLPAALISDLHDWTGLLMGFFVFLHLLINRRWIISTTKKILAGTATPS